MSKPISTTRTLAVLWKAPLAGALTIQSAVLVATVAFALAGLTPAPGGAANPRLVFAGALAPVVLIVLATVAGLLWAVSSIAVLTGEAAAGRHPRLRSALRRGLRALPLLVAVAVLGSVAVLVSTALFPVVSLGALARAGWRLRAGTGRRSELLLAIPFAGTVVVLAALPVALACVLARTGLRAALRTGMSQTWRGRGRVLLGSAVLALASWALGLAGIHLGGVLPSGPTAAARTTAELATGTAGLGLTTLLLTVVAGALLGVLSTRLATTDPSDPPARDLGLRLPRQRSARLLSWRPARIAGTALTVTVALTFQLAGTAAATPLPAAVVPAAAAAAGADIVVTDLTDSLSPAAGECVDPAASCTLRGALALATDRLVAGPVTVGFDVSGTLALVDTLQVPKGLTLDATGHDVTLDAGGAFRALQVFDPAGESAGGQATLRGLTVANGRSAGAGAGLYSDNSNVVLEQMTFTDNTSGTDPPDGSRTDGGAVAVPYVDLTVRGSTFARNRALTGTGAAVSAGALDWLNSTSYEDHGVIGEPNGGAILANAGTVSHATLVGGGGIAGGGSAPLVVTNSIVDLREFAGDFACMAVARDTDDPRSAGNLDATGACFGQAGRPAPHGPLADNGGPTQTVAIFPGSPALGAGVGASCAPTDQRGAPRPTGRCDAGAFQMAGGDVPVVDISLISDQNPAGHGGPVTLRATLTSAQPVPAGTVQLLEGATPVGAAVAPDGNGVALLTAPALSQGAHELTATFTPTDTSRPAVTSAPVRQVVLAPVTLTVTAPAPTRVHDPAAVTVTVVPAAGSDPALVPGGTVEVSSGSETATLPLVSGRATWTLPALPYAYVGALYNGDDNHAGSSATVDVTSGDIATTTVVTVDPQTTEYGTRSTATVRVSDRIGPVVGSVQLVVDGADLGNRRELAAGAASIELSLAPGRHSVLARTTPAAGWDASESVPVTLTVTPATSGVTLTAPATSSYGETVTATATLTGTGAATVELLVGDTVVDTSPELKLPTSFDLFARDDIDAGVHALTARVVGSATTAGSVSAPLAHTVTARPSGFSIAGGSRSSLGAPTTITILPDPSDVPGQVTLSDPKTGAVLANQPRPADGSANQLTYTAGTAGEHSVVARFQPDSANLLPAVVTVPFSVDRGRAPAPTATWSTTPTAASTTLTVQFPPMSPPLSPTTLVVIDHARNLTVAWGPLEGGRAELTFYGPAGQCYCTGQLALQLSGDDNYLPATFAVPDVDVPAHVSTTTLRPQPSSVARNAPLDLLADVRSTAAWSATGSVVFVVNGARQAPIALPNSGLAYLQYVPSGPGLLRISAEYRSDTTTVSSSSSTITEVIVQAAPLPSVRLTGGDSQGVGRSATVWATVGTDRDLVQVGTQVALVDEAGTVLSWSRWDGNRTAELTFTPTKAGPQQLRAQFVYGPEVDLGFSQPLSIEVPGRPAPLVLAQDDSAFAATVDGPLWLRARLILTEQERAALGAMPITLSSGGVVLETRTLHPWESSVLFQLSQDRKGPVEYTATTPGDGLNLTAGTARGLGVVTGAASELAVTSAESLLRGTYTVPFTLHGKTGRPAPTGQVSVAITTTDGVHVGGCVTQMPATSCTGSSALTEGLFTTTATYDGDGIYASSTGRNVLRVSTRSSGVTTTFSPPRDQWLEGMEVTASWTTTVPTGTDPDGDVVLEREGRDGSSTWLCTTPASTGTCEFTVPRDGVRLIDMAYDAQQSQDYRTTFTPSAPGVEPSTHVGFGPAAPACLPVAVTTARRPEGFRSNPNDLTVMGPEPTPTISGQPCSVGGVTGYREGTTVTVALAAQHPYVLGPWNLRQGNGEVAVGGTSNASPHLTTGVSPYTLHVWDSLVITGSYLWAPQCVSLRTTSEDHFTGGGAYDPGTFRLLTAPNCLDPFRPGEFESEDFDSGTGVGSYAVGTKVDLSAVPRTPRTPTAEKPTYEVLDVPGATRVDPSNRWSYDWTMTATRSQHVHAKFRLSKTMCTPTRFFTGRGGALALLGSTLDRTPSIPFEDPTGTCTDPVGRPGFWPGTGVDVTATGLNDGSGKPSPSNYRFHEWLEGDTPDVGLHHGPVVEEYVTAPATSVWVPAPAPTRVPAKAPAAPIRRSSSPFGFGGLFDQVQAQAERAAAAAATTAAAAKAVAPTGKWVTVPGAKTHVGQTIEPWPYVLEPKTSAEFVPRSFYAKVDRRVVVPVSEDFRFGATFSSVNCAPVELRVSYPATRRGTPRPEGLGMTPGNCPAMANDDAWTEEPAAEWIGLHASEQVAHARNRTWYTVGTTVTATGPAAMFDTITPAANWSDTQSLASRTKKTERTVEWAIREADAVSGLPALTRTPSVTVAAKERKVFDGRYVRADCRGPNVRVYPASYGYTGVDRGCPKGKIGNEGSGLYAQDRPGLKPVWVVSGGYDAVAANHPGARPKDPNSRTTYVEWRDIGFTKDTYGIELHYCKPIPVGASLRDKDWNHIPAAGGYVVPRSLAAEVLATGSTCPLAMSAYPGERTQLGLNRLGANAYKVLGWHIAGVGVQGIPTVSVDLEGNLKETDISVALTANCHRLTTEGPVDVNTPANCPGSGHRDYIHGTPVELAFDKGAFKGFAGWEGTDADKEGVAVVVMHSDRTAKAKTVGGLEGAVKVATALAQQAIAALITIATGIAAGFLYVVSAALLVVTAVTSGLRFLGVSGVALDKIDQFGDLVQSGLDVTQSLADCSVAWATGGAGPLLNAGTTGSQGVATGAGLAEEVLTAKGYGRANDLLGAAGNAFDVVNIFAGGLGSYFAEPSESWAAAAKIGTCMKDSGMAVADAGKKLGR